MSIYSLVKNPLPNLKLCAMVSAVTAKSVTRFETRINLEAQQDAYRPFLLPEFQHTYQFMAGLEGLPSGRPVTSNTGSLNPFSPVTKSSLRPWVTGSKIRGAYLMTIICRLALLKGNSTRLSDRRVSAYISLSFTNHQQAQKAARSLNAVVCAWQPVKQEAAA